VRAVCNYTDLIFLTFKKHNPDKVTNQLTNQLPISNNPYALDHRIVKLLLSISINYIYVVNQNGHKVILCFHRNYQWYLSFIAKLNLSILSGKSSDFLGDRGGRMRGGCITSTFATKSIIDSTRTYRAMNSDGTKSLLPRSPFQSCLPRRDRGPFGTLIKYLKYQYCFTLAFEHVIVLGPNRLNARMHSIYGNFAFDTGKLHNSFGTSASQSNLLS